MRLSRVVVAICLVLFVGCCAKPPVIEHRSDVTSAVETIVTVPGPCPENTVFVEGDYCPNAREVCLQWVDANGKATPNAIPTNGGSSRCGTWKFPTECLSKERVHKRFCIDKYEFGGSVVSPPKSWMSWYDAKTELAIQGKRLCTNAEWTMACEGPDLQPYPYGDGYHRDKTACNFDNGTSGIEVFKATSHETATARRLDNMLVSSGSMVRCVSPYGVYDMVGNIDEFVVNERGVPYVSGLKGGHVFGVRNACRPMTEAHGPTFSWYETGTRGCLSLPN